MDRHFLQLLLVAVCLVQMLSGRPAAPEEASTAKPRNGTRDTPDDSDQPESPESVDISLEEGTTTSQRPPDHYEPQYNWNYAPQSETLETVGTVAAVGVGATAAAGVLYYLSQIATFGLLLL